MSDNYEYLEAFTGAHIRAVQNMQWGHQKQPFQGSCKQENLNLFRR